MVPVRPYLSVLFLILLLLFPLLLISSTSASLWHFAYSSDGAAEGSGEEAEGEVVVHEHSADKQPEEVGGGTGQPGDEQLGREETAEEVKAEEEETEEEGATSGRTTQATMTTKRKSEWGKP